MPKDARKLHTGVQLASYGNNKQGNRVFQGMVTYTDADELEKSATPEQIAHLTAQGAIEGFDVAEAPEPKAPTKNAKK